jgi:hypothetical protein
VSDIEGNMTRCDGKPGRSCPVNDSTVKLSQGDLMLCPACNEYRFPSKEVPSKEKDKTRDIDGARERETEAHKENKLQRKEMTESSSKVVKEASNKCGDCGKTVYKKDNGVLCEVCDFWFHTTCEKVSEETYMFLRDEETVHWYCRGCNRGVKQVLTTMAEMRIEMTRMQKDLTVFRKEANDSIRDIKSELKEIKEELHHNQEREKKWADEFEGMRKELRVSDGKLETAMEAKLVETAEVTKCVQELKIIKGAVTETEEKYDGIIQEKFKETVREEKDRDSRKTNVVVFGLDESTSDIASDRKEHDREEIETIAHELQCNLKISNVIRMGKRIPQPTTGVGSKPRALTVVLENEQSKKELLDKAKNLRDTQYKKIFITQDLTPKERALRKEIVAERDRRVAKGEDVVIFRGKVVTRREKR